MQQLHLVGFTTDLEGLIFSARKGAKSGGYLVVLDEKLRTTVEDALRLRDGHSAEGPEGEDGPGRPRRPKPQSSLNPREIQARLRAGSSVAEVAAEAHVDQEWVARFAVPILAEQAQVVGRARRLTFVKSRLGPSAQPLGVAVRWNLADKGVLFFDDDFEAAWSAYNLQGASWVVRLQYVSRQKRHAAEWEVDVREGVLYSRNRVASELAYLDPSRHRRRPPVLEPSPRETPARATQPPATETTSTGSERISVKRPTASRTGPPKAKRAVKAAKAAKTAKTAKTGRAAKAGRATGTRKAASGTRARLQRGAKATKTVKVGRAAKVGKAGRAAQVGKAGRAAKARKKREPDHTVVAVPVVEESVRPSHLARPPSPMPSARRVVSPSFAPRPVIRPAPPPPRPAPPRPAPPRPAPYVDAEEAPVEVAEARPPEPVPTSAPATPPPLSTPAARRRRPPPTGEPVVLEPPVHSSRAPEQRLARRLAAGRAGVAEGTQRAGVPEGAPRGDGTERDAVWHGPGSGDPAPPVRIRADLAAGTIRPAEPVAPPSPPAPPTPRAGAERPARSRAQGRRERPLRAR